MFTVYQFWNCRCVRDCWKCVLFIVWIYLTVSLSNAKELVKCHGLKNKTGLRMECMSAILRTEKFNCSNPMPVHTIVIFSCKQFFKETSAPNLPFDAKSMRCSTEGQWTGYHHFNQFKCEYECGKAMPLMKTTVHNGKIVRRTTWSWHALIYIKVNLAKVVEALEYKKTYLNSSMGDSEGGDLNLDLVQLANIFENDDFSSEDMFDPRYGYLYICGGTLISDLHVLTAAHCLTDSRGQARTPKDFMVVLGGTSNNFYDHVNDPKSQIIPVTRMHISPDFDYDDYKSDIGIIELLQSAALSSAVLPACLPENGTEFVGNRRNGEVIGSVIDSFREGISNELTSKKLQVMRNADCVRIIGWIPRDGEFCAGGLSTNICSGDSGGGLVSRVSIGLRRKYAIHGIISYAKTRQVCENYAVFTGVHKFLTWIKHIIVSNETEF